MRPKLNKLITLLLILGTFVFIMEAEERVSSYAKKELSRWASILPVIPQSDIKSMNPYDQNVSLLNVILADSINKKVNLLHN